MMKKTKRFVSAAALSVAVLVLPLSVSALAQTEHVHEDQVVFASQHPCTKEVVEGDTMVKMTIRTTDNGDGTMDVQVRQHTHGQQLLGLVSQDWYVFNDAQDEDTETTIFGPSGSVDTWTRFIHTTEDLAYQEVQGEDDYFQKTTLFFSPFLPPVLVEDERPDCR